MIVDSSLACGFLTLIDLGPRYRDFADSSKCLRTWLGLSAQMEVIRGSASIKDRTNQDRPWSRLSALSCPDARQREVNSGACKFSKPGSLGSTKRLEQPSNCCSIDEKHHFEADITMPKEGGHSDDHGLPPFDLSYQPKRQDFLAV